MEIEKVIRILALFIFLAAFAVQAAACLLFPDAGHGSGVPVTLMMTIALIAILRNDSSKKNKANE